MSSFTLLNTRGRRVDLSLPPNKGRDSQRAYRARKAAHLKYLEKRVAELEVENHRLRMLLHLPPSKGSPIGLRPSENYIQRDYIEENAEHRSHNYNEVSTTSPLIILENSSINTAEHMLADTSPATKARYSNHCANASIAVYPVHCPVPVRPPNVLRIDTNAEHMLFPQHNAVQPHGIASPSSPLLFVESGDRLSVDWSGYSDLSSEYSSAKEFNTPFNFCTDFHTNSNQLQQESTV